MAKTTQPKTPQAQPEGKTITEAQLHDILITDRFETFFTLSMNRSIAAGDPKQIRDAAVEIYQILNTPPQQKPVQAEGAPQDNPDEPPNQD